MKTSVNWLANYINIPWPIKELTERLTLAGLEVESVETIGNIPDSVVVGEILRRDKHPNADKLSVCSVNIGDSEPLQIVCGASNCNAGVKVPVAKIGTCLGDGFIIKPAKLRGVESFGMMCSADELGLGSCHDGLLVLAKDSAVGVPVSNIIRPDAVVDWEVTPNRPDWLSHLGIAREIAALAGTAADLRWPQAAVSVKIGKDAGVKVKIDAPDLCPRYIARIIREVKIGPSPDWLRQALAAVGIRTVNNVVDITNYVLMECGQPLHAFDFNRVRGGEVVVRRAAAGECIKTLDDKLHQLDNENLLICDGSDGIALAGIMGGADSEICAETTTVLLESAAFNPVNIRATAKKLGISTESSRRFERGVSLDMVEFASRRAAALICQLAGGKICDDVVDVYPQPYKPHSVTCRPQRASSLLGVTVTAGDLAGYFSRLGLDVLSTADDGVTVSIPSFRLDLTREVDLIEEVARLFGLDNIPCSLAAAVMPEAFRSDAYAPVQEIRGQLQGLGLTEVMNYSFMSLNEATALTGFCADEVVKLSNPISAEAAVLRPSLVPGMVRVIAHNIAHGVRDLAFFEIGRVIATRKGVPEERWQVGIVVSGRRHPERFAEEARREVDFFDIKGIVEGLLMARGVVDVKCVSATHDSFNADACAAMTVKDSVIAEIGELAAPLTSGIRLEHPVFAAMLYLDKLQQAPIKERKSRPLPQFPATVRDISLLVPKSLTHAQIVAAIGDANEKLIENIRVFDIYEDEKVLGAGHRSVAYSITYRASDRTLKDDEANDVHERIRKRLAETLRVELR